MLMRHKSDFSHSSRCLYIYIYTSSRWTSLNLKLNFTFDRRYPDDLLLHLAADPRLHTRAYAQARAVGILGNEDFDLLEYIYLQFSLSCCVWRAFRTVFFFFFYILLIVPGMAKDRRWNYANPSITHGLCRKRVMCAPEVKPAHQRPRCVKLLNIANFLIIMCICEMYIKKNLWLLSVVLRLSVFVMKLKFFPRARVVHVVVFMSPEESFWPVDQEKSFIFQKIDYIAFLYYWII